MGTEEAWKKKVNRTARIARIIDRLEDVDDATLAQLDYLSRQAAADRTKGKRRKSDRGTRRDFLRAAAAGGVLIATTGALAVWQLSEGRFTAVENEAQALRALVDLYEQMDDAERDMALTAGLDDLTARITALQADAGELNEHLAENEAALMEFQASFPSMQTSLQWLEQTVATLSQRMLALENSLNTLLGVTGPATEMMGSFLAWLLSQLPPEESEEARVALERTGEVISTLPDLMEGLHNRILEPTRGWFSPHDDAGLNERLVNPLLEDVIAPAEALIAQIDHLSARWEEDLAVPLQRALEDQRAIRAQIDQHEAAYDL